LRIWAAAIVGVALVFGLAYLLHEKLLIGAGWFAVGFLWLLFAWLIYTVVARRLKRPSDTPSG
jgi:hypothetical protein